LESTVAFGPVKMQTEFWKAQYEGETAAFVPYDRKLNAFYVIWYGAGLVRDANHVARRHEEEFRLAVDEPCDEPRTSDAVDFRTFSCDPAHAASRRDTVRSTDDSTVSRRRSGRNGDWKRVRLGYIVTAISRLSSSLEIRMRSLFLLCLAGSSSFAQTRSVTSATNQPPAAAPGSIIIHTDRVIDGRSHRPQAAQW
jgi:hypothetical protein